MANNKNLNEDGKSTRFTSENQPKNRRKKSLMTKIVKRLFEEDEYLSLKGAELLDEKGNPTGRKVSVRIKLANDEAIVAHYLNRVKKSDKLLIDLMNRIDGKTPLNVDLTSGGEPIRQPKTEAELMAELEKIQKEEDELDRIIGQKSTAEKKKAGGQKTTRSSKRKK